MKKVLFSLSLLILCVCFLRVTMGNNALISSEEMIGYVTENFKLDDTIITMTDKVSDAISIINKTTKYNIIEKVTNFIDKYDKIGFLSWSADLIKFIVDFIMIAVYGLVIITATVVAAIPIITSLLNDSLVVLRLFLYVIFGMAL